VIKSFQDGNRRVRAGRGGEAPLAPKDLLLREGGKSLPKGMDISAQDGWIRLAVDLKAAQAMPGQGWHGAGGMHWHGKVPLGFSAGFAPLHLPARPRVPGGCSVRGRHTAALLTSSKQTGQCRGSRNYTGY